MACSTGYSPFPISGPVRIAIGDDDGKVATAISDLEFSYVEPKVTHLFPLKGPKSGGTKITIKGTVLYDIEYDIEFHSFIEKDCLEHFHSYSTVLVQ